MERFGFINEMKDVKILVLYVAARAELPLSAQEIYELCYQDEKLTYFDVIYSVDFLEKSGHLQSVDGDKYVITDKGRQNGSALEDVVAFTVREKARRAVESFNREARRSKLVNAEMFPRGDGTFTARLTLGDGTSELMTLELMAPNQPQAAAIKRSFYRNAELIYNFIMDELLDEENFGE